MLQILRKAKKAFFPFCLLAVSFCQAGEELDKSEYISIDEIRPGMEAYCLTTYKGTEIEKFGLEVLDVISDVRLGRDEILVQGTDERFIRTGPVHGCSGSPVYIDGRLAGALAWGWAFSKDPLYRVTPIKEMLKVGEDDGSRQSVAQMGFAFDFSKPIDFAEIDKQIVTGGFSRNNRLGGAGYLPCPLIVSGLPDEVFEQLNASIGPLGFVAVAGIGGGSPLYNRSQNKNTGSGTSEGEDAQLVPGASLAVPVVTGDITMTAIGTVTEVIGDKVYGFGHGLLGYGAIDLPMATGKVHTVVSNIIGSFKLSSALEIVGALTTDESAAVCGRIGAKAKMIPLTIRVERYNDAEKRVYNCQLASNRLLTPLVLRAVIAGTSLMIGTLPPNHMIEYKVAIGIKGAESVIFENISSGMGLLEVITEGTGPVAVLMSNPYKKIDIESIDVDVRISAKNIISHIWSVDISDSRVKSGQRIEIEVVVESFLAVKKKYQFSLKIPDELSPGKYDLIVCGGYGYREFLKQTAPYRFIPQDLGSLIGAMNNLLHISRDKLYCLLVLPSSGVSVERAELPDLPATKALVLQDAKRTLRTRPYPHWLEKDFRIGTVVVDKKVMHITVEE